MNPADLAKQCADSINMNTRMGFKMDEASICVTTPKGWKCPPRFPRGRIVQWKEDGTRVRYLRAVNVLAWLAANCPDHVKLETKVGP
jgi:hypothetical protein